MHSLWLIARREYIERVRTRGFLITTIMIPMVMAIFVFGSIFLGSRENMDRRIVVVSSDISLAEAIHAELEKSSADAAPPSQPEPAPSFSLRAAARAPRFTVDLMQPASTTRDLLDRQLDQNQIDGYLWVRPGADGSAPTYSWESRSSSDHATHDAVADAFNKVLLRQQLAHRGVTPGEADELTQPVELHSSQESHHHDRASSMISIAILFFLMYLVIMLYGMNVARSIIEEKTSRVFEVMLAAVRPEEMMAGKILGVGAVGITQMAIWLSAVLLATASRAGISLGGETLHPTLTAPQVGYFLVFFLLGYLFYSAIAAALGAMTNSEQELQQLNVFLMMPLLLCFVVLGTVMFTPDGALARWLAFFPPFTPLLMYMRVSLGHPRGWEVGLSIVMLITCIAGLIWLTSRIYRVGVLMYGKRPTVSELMRWLKYS